MIKIGYVILSLIVSIILARNLGAERFGVYAFVFALINVLAMPAHLGLPHLVVRETAKAATELNWPLMRGLWRWSTMAVLFFSVIIAFVSIITTLGLNEYIDGERAQTFLFGLALIPLIALGNLRGAALRGLRRVVLGQFPESIIRPALFLVLIVLAPMFLSEPLGPSSVMALHALAAGIAFLIGAWLLYEHRPHQFKGNPYSTYKLNEWVGATIPLALISGLQLINQYADIIMLGLFRSNDEVGIYRVASQGSILVAFGLQSINLVVMPHFTHLNARGDIVRLQRLATLSARLSFFLAFPIVCFYVLFGKYLLGNIFGVEFTMAYMALLILSGGQLINATMEVGRLLTMTGHENRTLRVFCGAAMLNIVLNLILIPVWGVEGAALATALTLAMANIRLRIITKEVLNIDTFAFKGILSPFLRN